MSDADVSDMERTGLDGHEEVTVGSAVMQLEMEGTVLANRTITAL